MGEPKSRRYVWKRCCKFCGAPFDEIDTCESCAEKLTAEEREHIASVSQIYADLCGRQKRLDSATESTLDNLEALYED